MDGASVVQLAIIIVLMFVIIIGNSTMCICIFQTKRLHNPAGYIVASLAVADFLVGIWLLPFSIPSVIAGRWSIGQTLCNVNGYTNHVLCSASMLNLLAVSLDRYTAIFYPLRYKEYMTTARAVILISLAWFYAFLTASFPLVGWARYVFEPGIWLCVTDFKISYSFSYFIIATIYVVPLTIMSIVYYKIFLVAYKHMSSMRNQVVAKYGTNDDCSTMTGPAIVNAWADNVSSSKVYTGESRTNNCSNSEKSTKIKKCRYIDAEDSDKRTQSEIRREEKKRKTKMRKELRTGIVLFFIVIIFVISWSPFAIVNLIALHTKIQPSVLAEAIVSRLAYMNSAVNPPLYCLMNKTIRNSVKRLWWKVFSVCGIDRLFGLSPPVNIEETEM